MALQIDFEAALEAIRKTKPLANPSLMLARWQAALRQDETLDDLGGGKVRIVAPLVRSHRGRYAAFFPAGDVAPHPDAALIAALARAVRWRNMMATGEAKSIDDVANRIGTERTHVGRTLKLAFLSPDTIRAILDGCQPRGLTLAHLLDANIPLLWRDQPAFLTNLTKPV